MIVTKYIKSFVKQFIEKCFPSIASTYRCIRDNKPIVDEPKYTSMGFKFIGNSSMESGAYEPDVTRIVKMILKKVDIVINVGANIGYYCCLALQEDKYVVAFEPHRSNLRYLYKNIRANYWEDRIEIFPMALSDRVGIVEIFGGGQVPLL